jgi:hypothetical protein
MTDEELVKRLRPLSWSDIDARFGVPMDETMREAADRIEALTAKVKLMDDLDIINGEKIEALTAKLAKAVEAVSLTVRADNLREAYHALPNDHNRIGDKRSRKGHAREAWLRAFRKAAKTSRATLAEIEGEKE